MGSACLVAAIMRLGYRSDSLVDSTNKISWLETYIQWITDLLKTVMLTLRLLILEVSINQKLPGQIISLLFHCSLLAFSGKYLPEGDCVASTKGK